MQPLLLWDEGVASLHLRPVRTKQALSTCEATANSGGRGANSPLRGRVGAVERVLELNDVPVLLLQLPVVLHVILHQLCQGGKLLSAVKVIVISRVLDFNVGDGTVSPAQRWGGEKKKNNFSYRPPPFGFLDEAKFISPAKISADINSSSESPMLFISAVCRRPK